MSERTVTGDIGDTAKLIAQAREHAEIIPDWTECHFLLALADALEAAEAMHLGQRAAKMDALLRAEKAEAALRYIRSILDAYSDDDGPGASLVALGKIGNRIYAEITGV